MKCSKGSSMPIVGARPSQLRGELVNKNCRKEPVCLKCSKGSLMGIVRARLSGLRGELVNKNCRKEPVCF